MSLPLQDFSTLVNTQIASIEAESKALVDFSVGSILRALVESNAGIALWLEAVATQLLAVTRLSTSTGTDIDSFIADFGLTRIPAKAATGQITLSRATPLIVGNIPVGSIVSSSLVSQNYVVGIDTSNIYYNATQGAYIVPVGVSSTIVPVTAVSAGVSGNVPANYIDTINSIMIGIDTVTNAAPIANGANQESDAAVRARFVLYLQSLSKATKAALQAAILSVSGVTRFNLVENKDIITAAEHLGYFFAVIDDGSGSPSPQLLQSVSSALDATRAFTVAYGVFSPSDINITISVNLKVNASASQTSVRNNVTTAINSYLEASGFGAFLPYTRLLEVIYDADSNIINAHNLLVNGSTADITALNNQVMLLVTPITIVFET